jgi:pimeloyl-ACP methyl ester carboxylesterase
MPYIALDNMRMYYEEHGTPDGTPLVLLHGFTQIGSAWAKQLEAFGAHYRLLIPDLRGHGRTDNPGGAAAMNHRQFARDIIALCRGLDVEQAAFCGESTGAMLLLTLALEAAGLVSACILAGGTYFYGDELRAWWQCQTPDTNFTREDQIRTMQARHTALGADHWRSVTAAWIGLGDHAHSEDFPEPEQLRAIQAPVLIVHGDRDFYFPVEVPTTLYRLLSNAELCMLPHTGHEPPAERPAWFNAIVLDFLQRRYVDSAQNKG